MKKVKKVIFLDMDGVLQTPRAKFSQGGHFGRFRVLDTVGVNLVRQMCVFTNSKIVISSTWRKTVDVVDILMSHGIPFGMFMLDWRTGNEYARKVEIEQYVKGHNITNYVILDDQAQGWFRHQRPHLVATPHDDGITFANFVKAVNILGPNKLWFKRGGDANVFR